MNRWWTADLHLGHANIVKYCRRPFINHEKYIDQYGSWKSAELKDDAANRNNERLIAAMNSRIKPGDTVMHVGDFCCKGGERGVSGTKTKANGWECILNGKWIFILGNHDSNNTVRFGIYSAVVDVGPIKAFVVHRPPERLCEIPDFCELVICGHVHEKWKWNWCEERKPMLNVGVDIQGFKPISDSELIGMYYSFLRTGK